MGFAAALSARNGITQIATDFLKFKADSLDNYANTQWSLLEDNNLTSNIEFVNAARDAVESFARSLIRSETEIIFGIDDVGVVQMNTGELSLSQTEVSDLLGIYKNKESGWFTLTLGGSLRVAQGFYLESFKRYVFVSELRSTFYGSVLQIYYQSGLILFVAALTSIILLGLFISYLTSPLSRMISVIREIIKENDLSKRISLLYRDEIGELGHTFNLMSSQLEKAYDQVKNFAYKAVVAEKNEKKIRNIFQKYVPHNVIEQFFNDPDGMLTGSSRELAVLFSDIRGFTTISEEMLPEMVVESLNKYFEHMVDIIIDHDGIVDKYMGDAIMAFYGAPVQHKNDSLLAVQTGLDMLDEIKNFNIWQLENNRPSFDIGIGINYGQVTVGNIGSEKKMDYTVIGDMVNTASRLEGLTKIYGRPFIISGSVYEKIKDNFPCQQLDNVAVKGRQQGIPVYSVQRELSIQEDKSYQIFSEGLEIYNKRKFKEALNLFWKGQNLFPSDKLFDLYINRCIEFIDKPPSEDWNGVTVMDHK
jgi:adenylate cyclase